MGCSLIGSTKAKKSNFPSLRPQMHEPGPTHFFEPASETVKKVNSHDVASNVLINTDVSLPNDDDSMALIQGFRANTTLFFEMFANAYLHVSELGYGLVDVGSSSTDTSYSPSLAPINVPSVVTDGPTTTLVESPIASHITASPPSTAIGREMLRLIEEGEANKKGGK